ncbi:MAG: hypothetical protein DWQ31_20275 [Planctomycetota bacterium]|nr:MAG: hypothetical protein DWQ31_20275 [Planctomycetota bacterium]REJ96473.1 MAG: hypothetical protein DWQ35_04570 [Planctomycetota bacterium]REK25117.1 MAG: hypothetical protein DWQ42_12160 [Planctomycetota bacterium]REK44685.1 MAG: hypothetical protein DWQ46_08925 [Planctomycetota bacterium]
MRNRRLGTSLLLAALVAVVTVLVATRGGEADDTPNADPKKTAAFMRAKLASSQKVLEGLVSKDFDLIASGSKELEQMSDAAAFQRFPDPVYRHYSREFRRLAGKLNRLAVDRNLEGASFTYMHATTTCISCHEYVRDVIKVADAAADGGEIETASDRR